jgi:hypothetical protein
MSSMTLSSTWEAEGLHRAFLRTFGEFENVTQTHEAWNSRSGSLAHGASMTEASNSWSRTVTARHGVRE